MVNYYKHLIVTCKRLLLVVLLFSLSRLVFYGFNFNFFSSLSFGQVLLHLYYGIRFDIAIIFICNLPFIIFSLVPAQLIFKKTYQLLLKIFFLVVNAFLLGFNFIDAKFYEFEGRRLTADFFNKEWLGEDFITLLPSFIKDYWYLFIGFILFVWFFAKIYPLYKPKREKLSKLAYLKQVVLALVLIIFSVFLCRGGFQLKPIGIITAARYTSPQNMALILNSPFTIVKTLGKERLSKSDYYNLRKLDSIYSPVQQFKNYGNLNKKNVVVIILESFGKEYSGYLNDTVGFTPNLDSIMQLGFYCKNAFANGKRSIEALPSIFSSIPALMDNAFVSTQFASNSIYGIGELLCNQGYETAFFHGGKNGTMGFDNFVKYIGIEHYYGLDEYPNDVDYDGNWGIYDEPYLQYFAKELNNFTKPFFASVFTLSSHHPYKIPNQFRNKFPKGELINHESIGYADYALGRFFITASNQPWFNNTLFVITADHTAQSKNAYYKTNVGKYSIPIVFYDPGNDSLKGNSDKICQQTDILPTILDYLNFNNPFVAFGNSIFDASSNGFAINYNTGVYQIIMNESVLTFDGKETLNVETLAKDTLSAANSDSVLIHAHKEVEDKLKGIIQQYNFRMQHNLMRNTSTLSELKDIID